MTLTRGLAVVFAAALAGAALSASRGALGADVGVINHLAGLVTITNGVGTAKAQAYMNINEGDRFEVPAGVIVKVAYFQGGRQESFEGPVSFVVGASQSVVRRGSGPQVTLLPSGVPQKISQTPDLVHIAKLGAAGTQPQPSLRELRLTPQQQAEVRQARQIYTKLRAETPADDITPELYLYSVLQDHLLYTEMRFIVAEMGKRQPGNRDVMVLTEYVRLKTEPR